MGRYFSKRREYVPEGGNEGREPITKVADNMVKIAMRIGKPVYARYYDILIIVKPRNNPRTIVRKFHNALIDDKRVASTPRVSSAPKSSKK